MSNSFLDRFADHFRRQARAQVSKQLRSPPKRGKQWYKYEIRFVARLNAYPLAEDRFIQDIVEGSLSTILTTASGDLTFENVQNHKKLVDNGVLKGGATYFLLDILYHQVDICIAHVVQLGGHNNGYNGACENIRRTVRDAVFVAYRQACNLAYDSVLQQNDDIGPIASQLDVAARESLPFKYENGRFGVDLNVDVASKRQIFTHLESSIRNSEFHLPHLENLHPRLVASIKSYIRVFRGEPKDAVSLFLHGGDIQSYLSRYGNVLSAGDKGRDMPPVDPDALASIDALILRHTAFVAGSPELEKLLLQYDKISQISGANVDTIRDIVPLVHSIAMGHNLFSANTKEIAATLDDRLSIVSSDAPNREEATAGASKAAAVGLARGSISAIGRFGLDAISAGTKDAVSSTVSDELKRPETWAAARAFLASQQDNLESLARSLPSAFGWITAVYRLFLRDPP